MTDPRNLPKEITTYDLLKTFAVVFMVVDHVGWYFFPDDTWWRVAGRLCVPVWFFLIGYANSRDLGPRLWIGAAILIVSDLVAGISLFPGNILCTMILVRLLLNPLMERALRSRSTFWGVNTMLFLLMLPGNMFFEYGTLGFILAAYGYLLRRREEIAASHKDLIEMHFAFALVSFVSMQYINFGLEQDQGLAMMIGILAVMGVLYFFRPATLPRLTARLPRTIVWLLQLTGRRTLEIYIVHLVIFKAIAMVLEPERFPFLEFHLFYRPEDHQ